MRAVFCDLKESAVGEVVIISGDRAHHLQVVRVKIDEEVLVLNGMGQRFFSKVIEVTKKEVVLKILKIESLVPLHQINLAIALPKKDAFEDILRISVELGIGHIYPLSSEFSQYQYAPSERIDRLLESALVQSNNLYLPQIAKQTQLNDYINQLSGSLVYFSASPAPLVGTIDTSSEITVLIGPEAGFSAREEEQIQASKNIKIIHLPTPILRAPTAVATSVGYLLGRLS